MVESYAEEEEPRAIMRLLSLIAWRRSGVCWSARLLQGRCDVGRRGLASLGVVVTVVALSLVRVAGQTATAAPPEKSSAQPKSWKVPRTAWGDPDLQGLFSNNNATPLERPKELAGRARLTPEELANLKRNAAELFNGDTDAAFGDSVFLAALRGSKGFNSTDTTGNYNHFWLVDREFDNRTSLITDPPDGRVPALTVEAQRREAAREAYSKAHPYDGPEDIALSLRCVTRGLPLIQAGYNSYYQIVQAPGYVALQQEMIHDTRIIPLDGRARADGSVRRHLGESRGHWEGDTLVVETASFTDKPSGTVQLQKATSGKLHVVERFTRVSPTLVQYEATIDDPETWTRPWTVMVPWRQTADQIYEFACHEGNESMVGTLGGARAQERAQAASKGSK
jgi:hypothetical protein